MMKEKYSFANDYMHETENRVKLNEFTNNVFGFDFEDWYSFGGCGSDYIPYSYLCEGKMISNASANIMHFNIKGENKTFIQIGTVETNKAYRKCGLAGDLIERILDDYRGKCDGFYLFAEPEFYGFYQKHGFSSLNEYRCEVETVPDKEEKICFSCMYGIFLPTSVKDEHLAKKYYEYLKKQQKYALLTHCNSYSLEVFYTREMKNAFYCRETDMFANYRIANDTCYLDSVVSVKPFSLCDVLPRIPGIFHKIVFGFTPADGIAGLKKFCYDGGDDYVLCFIGEDVKKVESEKLLFPVYSHA